MAEFNFPTFIQGTVPLLKASIDAYLDAIDEIDYTQLNNLIDFDTATYEELLSFFEFFRILPLFSRIFTVERMREIAKHGDELNHYRGTEYVLSLFSTVVNVEYSWTIRRDSQMRAVGIHFIISPPTGINVDDDWAGYMRDAFTFLLPSELTIDNFTISLLARETTYLYGTAFITLNIP